MSDVMLTIEVRLVVSVPPRQGHSPDKVDTAAKTLAVKALRAVYRAWDAGPVETGMGKSLSVTVNGEDVSPPDVWSGVRNKGDP
jgi:hypothetical protein